MDRELVVNRRAEGIVEPDPEVGRAHADAADLELACLKQLHLRDGTIADEHPGDATLLFVDEGLAHTHVQPLSGGRAQSLGRRLARRRRTGQWQPDEPHQEDMLPVHLSPYLSTLFPARSKRAVWVREPCMTSAV